MKSLLLSVFVLFAVWLSAQSSYPLHPSVGDTIDRNEKLDYSLFPKVANQDFKFAIIEFEKDSFFLAISNISSAYIKRKFLSKEELIEAQKTIEKVNRYYRYRAAQPVDTNSYRPELTEIKGRPIRMDGPMTEQMKKEARMNIRLREDERKRREFDQGIRGQQLFLGFD